MFHIAVLLCMVPFVWLSDWFGFIKRLPPVQAELTKASHGAVMTLGAAWLAWWRIGLGYGYGVPIDYQIYILPFLAFIAIWGLFWLAVGAARTRYYRDYHLLGRAAVKVALAPAIWWLAGSWPQDLVWQVQAWDGAMLVAGWCAVTGLVKIVLLLRPLPSREIDGVNPMPYGPSDFSDGSGFG